MTPRTSRHFGIGAILLACMSATAGNETRGVGIEFLNPGSNSGKPFSSILVAVSCAHFETVTNIPDDWYIQTLRPALSDDPRWKPFASSSEGLELAAGHGVSRLTDLKKLNGGIRLVIENPKCFHISVVVEDDMSDEGWPRTMLSSADLVLK